MFEVSEYLGMFTGASGSWYQRKECMWHRWRDGEWHKTKVIPEMAIIGLRMQSGQHIRVIASDYPTVPDARVGKRAHRGEGKKGGTI